jgi:hypothetical protein
MSIVGKTNHVWLFGCNVAHFGSKEIFGDTPEISQFVADESHLRSALTTSNHERQ